MTRPEMVARALIVGGTIVGIATVGIIIGQRIFGSSTAPGTESLGPLLEHGTVVHERERGDLRGRKGTARSLLLAVPEAANQEIARTGLLRLLRTEGWSVSSGGGAVPPNQDVCLVVSTPTSWLSDRVNRSLRDDFETKLNETESTAVIVDAFFC